MAEMHKSSWRETSTENVAQLLQAPPSLQSTCCSAQRQDPKEFLTPWETPGQRFVPGAFDGQFDRIVECIERHEAWMRDRIVGVEMQMKALTGNIERLNPSFRSPLEPVAPTTMELVEPSTQTISTRTPDGAHHGLISAERSNELKVMFERLQAQSDRASQDRLFVSELIPIVEEYMNGVSSEGVEKKLAAFSRADDAPPYLDFECFCSLMEATPERALPLQQAITSWDAVQRERELEFEGDDEGELPDQKILSARGYLALDLIPAIIVLCNTMIMGVQIDVAKGHLAWDIVELCFTFAFTMEALIKMRLFSVHTYLFGPDRYWNWFDLFCITIAYIDLFFAWIMTQAGVDLSDFFLLKMLRLGRLARLVRLLRFKIFTELKSMVVGVFSGLRTLVWAFVLMFGIVFLVAVIMRNIMGEAYPEFISLPASMFTVFRCFTGDCSALDGTPLPERLKADNGWLFVWCYCIMDLFIEFGLFNLIMAIFIDNVVSASVAKKRRELGECAGQTRRALESMVTNLAQKHARDSDDNEITRDAFSTWLKSEKEFVAFMEDAGIECSAKYEMFDVLDSNMNGSLKHKEIVDGLMSLRGDVSKTDIIAVRMKVRFMTQLLEEIALKNAIKYAD